MIVRRAVESKYVVIELGSDAEVTALLSALNASGKNDSTVIALRDALSLCDSRAADQCLQCGHDKDTMTHERRAPDLINNANVVAIWPEGTRPRMATGGVINFPLPGN